MDRKYHLRRTERFPNVCVSVATCDNNISTRHLHIYTYKIHVTRYMYSTYICYRTQLQFLYVYFIWILI